MTTETPRDGAVLQAAVDRGLMVWAWVVMLGAYIATSSLFAGRFGAYFYNAPDPPFMYRSPAMFLVYCLFLVPLAIQIVGWLAVGQYSLQISEHLLGTPPARPAGDLKRVLRRAIICLVASWIVLLLFSFMPTIQGWIATNAVVG